jgi:hypothetical protein
LDVTKVRLTSSPFQGSQFLGPKQKVITALLSCKVGDAARTPRNTAIKTGQNIASFMLDYHLLRPAKLKIAAASNPNNAPPKKRTITSIASPLVSLGSRSGRFSINRTPITPAMNAQSQ